MTLFSEKNLISHIKCIHGLMPNLIKKSWTVSNASMIHVRVLQQYILHSGENSKSRLDQAYDKIPEKGGELHFTICHLAA